MRRIITMFFFLSLSACGSGGSGGGDQVPEDDNNPDAMETESPPAYTTPDDVVACSADDLKMRVDFDMRDYYIYYDQVPSLNLGDYETPESLIRDLRVDPDIYSFVTDLVAQQELVNSGKTEGYGVAIAEADDGLFRFREIRGGSPADLAGVLRGDAIVTINDIPVEDYTPAQRPTIFTEANSPVNMTVSTGSDAPRAVSVAYSEYVWRTAGPASRFTNTTNPALPVVGYLPIRTFLQSTQNEINAALADLQNRGGFEELVVDLRYNPGGRTSVVRHIASIVGGEAVANEVFLLRNWNDKYSELNSVDYFDEIEDPLNLPRVFVLVTGRSASASEVFINALEPYIDVVVIGGVTDGKPFTSNSREYCDKSINAMRSLRTNASGVSVAGGIQPDCNVQDDWQERQNSVRDPLLSAALSFVSSGVCPSVPADAPMSRDVALRATETEFSELEIFVPEE